MVGSLVGHKGLDRVGEFLECECGSTARGLLPGDEMENGRILTIGWVVNDKENMVLEPCHRSNYSRQYGNGAARGTYDAP